MKKCLSCGCSINRVSKKFYLSDYNWNKVKYCSNECRDLFWKKKGNGVKAYLKLRFDVFKRDNFKCIYCGRSPIEDGSVKLELEHIEPTNGKPTKQMWEKSREEDLATACKECNLGKSNRQLTVKQIKRIKKRNLLVIEK